MAINWILALKAVPWTDLVQAAPSIVKGARSLFANVRSGSTVEVAKGPKGSPETRLEQIEAALSTLDAEQRASSELIRSLAEQNAKMVEAMAILRARARILLAACALLTLAVGLVAVWVALR